MACFLLMMFWQVEGGAHFSITGSRRLFEMYGQNSQKFVSQNIGSRKQPATNSARSTFMIPSE
jgi:hypothetical protein